VSTLEATKLNPGNAKLLVMFGRRLFPTELDAATVAQFALEGKW
jgi:hypothetical protein